MGARLRDSPHHGLHLRHKQLQGVFAWNVKGKRHSTCKHISSGNVYVHAPPAISGIASAVQFPLFTIMVVDAHQRGRPVAWALLGGNERIENIVVWLRAFLQRAQQRQPGWMPEAIMVDNSNAEIGAIRYEATLHWTHWQALIDWLIKLQHLLPVLHLGH